MKALNFFLYFKFIYSRLNIHDLGYIDVRFFFSYDNIALAVTKNMFINCMFCIIFHMKD